MLRVFELFCFVLFSSSSFVDEDFHDSNDDRAAVGCSCGQGLQVLVLAENGSEIGFQEALRLETMRYRQRRMLGSIVIQGFSFESACLCFL